MKPIARMIGEAFDVFGAIGPPQWPQPARLAPRRRKKLWELAQRGHCPLVGTCLPVADMRRLAKSAGIDADGASDHALHTTFVGHCAENNAVAKRVQRFLDERFAAAVTRFNQVRGEAAVLALWREAVGAGDVAGALWAAWSHPDLGEEGGKEIYGDIHMLSHQVGAAARADLRRLEQLAKENARRRDEAAALRIGLAEAERQRDRTRVDCERRLADAEQRAALLPHRELELAEARQAARNYRTVLERAEALAARVERLEERNAVHARRAESLARDLNETQDSLAAAETALESALGVCAGVNDAGGCGRTCPAEAALDGRCVLCIGGRVGLVEGYRRLVETRGGRFLHHDGGQQESLHRIDVTVAAADAVVCQAGCVSHAAYFRLKDACKKLGKPCVFVQSPGIGSFARSLAALAAAAPAEQVIRLPS